MPRGAVSVADAILAPQAGTTVLHEGRTTGTAAGARARARSTPHQDAGQRGHDDDGLDRGAAARLRHRDHRCGRGQRPHRHRRAGPSRRHRHSHHHVADRPRRPHPRGGRRDPRHQHRARPRARSPAPRGARGDRGRAGPGVPRRCPRRGVQRVVRPAAAGRGAASAPAAHAARPAVPGGAPGDRPAGARPGGGPVPPRQAQAGGPVRLLPGHRVRCAAQRRRRRGRHARRAGADPRPVPAPGGAGPRDAARVPGVRAPRLGGGVQRLAGRAGPRRPRCRAGLADTRTGRHRLVGAPAGPVRRLSASERPLSARCSWVPRRSSGCRAGGTPSAPPA